MKTYKKKNTPDQKVQTASKASTEQNTPDNLIAKMTKELNDAATTRREKLLKRPVPESRTLKNALATLTKSDLSDIAYNVGATVKDTQKKATMIDIIAPAIQAFAGHWFVTIIDEQYNAFKHLLDKDGISSEFREDEMRLDYFQSLGLLFGAGKNGKVVWYMPDEISEEFKKLDSGAYRQAVEFNTDVLRLATGILFYYGVLDHDELFAMVKKYLGKEAKNEAGFGFAAFMGIIMTGCCWQYVIKMDQRFVAYYTVMNPEKIHQIAHSRDITFAKLSYGQIYDAGEENYIEATDSYKSLAQFLMQEFHLDVMRAANIVSQLTIVWQNDGNPKAGLEYITSLGNLSPDKQHELEALVMGFHHSMRFWIFRGHTPSELISGKLDPAADNVVSFAAHKNKNKKKIGRNDPCPCGSGKKYKNCCLRNSNEETE